MTNELPFGEVLEAVDHLSHDEQEEFIAILHRRLAQASRQRLSRSPASSPGVWGRPLFTGDPGRIDARDLEMRRLLLHSPTFMRAAHRLVKKHPEAGPIFQTV